MILLLVNLYFAGGRLKKSRDCDVCSTCMYVSVYICLSVCIPDFELEGFQFLPLVIATLKCWYLTR